MPKAHQRDFFASDATSSLADLMINPRAIYPLPEHLLLNYLQIYGTTMALHGAYKKFLALA
jgi:hypothetical protein